MMTSLAYWRRMPGGPATTSPPFQCRGRRITNWASWFQPWVVLKVEVSGK